MHAVPKALVVLALLSASACAEPAAPPTPTPTKTTTPLASPPAATQKEEPVTNPMKVKVDKFAPVVIGVDEARISAELRPVVKRIIEAAKIIDDLFLHQVARENAAWRAEIAKDPKLVDTLAYFDIMYGPWDRLDSDKPFWGEKKNPPGGTFYPEDLTAAELSKYLAAHPEQKDALTSYFTLIERDGDKLKTVPYSEAYRKWLEPAAKLLNEAADLSKDPRLQKYLRSRAAAFASNEYRPSDMDWMDLGDGALEIVIGPYEVYNDQLMGWKAAFEAFVTLRDEAASQELAKIQGFIPEMEKNLPLPDEHKGKGRGLESPISVVEVLFNAGDNRAGIQTLAFNLPNDEVVRDQKGSKKVMLKNVAEAKYEKILVPIATRLMRPDQLKNVSFDAFFGHTLVHETAHGIGPGNITVTRDGKQVKTSVNQELKDLYSTIEEAKADVLGLHEALFLIEKGLHPETFREQVYATFLGGFFRSVRFGATEAHGRANVIQFNYLMEKGAVVREADGRYAYVAEKMPAAVRDLAHDILMLEATGDYAGAQAFIEKYGTMPAELTASLAGLADIPTDIRPTYPIEKLSASW